MAEDLTHADRRRGLRRLFLGLIAGTLIRAVLLPLPGTSDVIIWKVWSANAAMDLTGVYGVGGTPAERRVLSWHGHDMTVDYPPLSLEELALAGRAYRLVHPGFTDTRWLNAFMKLPGLAAEVALVIVLLTWGRRVLGDAAAEWMALAWWLNPLVILNGAALGYLDAQMAVPLVLAVMTAWAGRGGWTGALVAIAVLTKAQAVFAVPAIATILYWRSARTRALIAGASAGLAASALILLPFVVRGAIANVLQAVGRLATHDMLSAQAANVWWIVTWALRVVDAWHDWGAWRALTQDVRILAISSVQELGYPDPSGLAAVLALGAIGWACWQLRRSVTLARAAAIAGWSIYAYAMLAVRVHENHWYAAVPLFALAAASDRRYRPVCGAVSLIAALNLYLFYGLGIGWPPLVQRGWTGVDMAVALSVVNIVVFVRAGVAIRDAPRPRSECG